MCLVHEQVWFMSTHFSWHSSVVLQIAYVHGCQPVRDPPNVFSKTQDNKCLAG